jgi:hypothetical protein
MFPRECCCGRFCHRSGRCTGSWPTTATVIHISLASYRSRKLTMTHRVSGPLRWLGELIGWGLMALASSLPAQTRTPIRVAMSSTSTVPMSDLQQGFEKKCPDVILNRDPARADYALEAIDRTRPVDAGEVSRYWFTLFNRAGNAIYSTSSSQTLSTTFVRRSDPRARKRSHRFTSILHFFFGIDDRLDNSSAKEHAFV